MAGVPPGIRAARNESPMPARPICRSVARVALLLVVMIGLGDRLAARIEVSNDVDIPASNGPGLCGSKCAVLGAPRLITVADQPRVFDLLRVDVDGGCPDTSKLQLKVFDALTLEPLYF